MNLSAVRAVPCENQSGIRPNRKLQRGEKDRVIIEHKGRGAFNHHVGAIQNLAAGHGTEILFHGNETGALSIILKVSIPSHSFTLIDLGVVLILRSWETI